MGSDRRMSHCEMACRIGQMAIDCRVEIVSSGQVSKDPGCLVQVLSGGTAASPAQCCSTVTSGTCCAIWTPAWSWPLDPGSQRAGGWRCRQHHADLQAAGLTLAE